MDTMSDLPHSHCDSCVLMRCSVKVEENISCAMIYCEYDCGSKFHTCKLAEHNLWCPNQKVKCVNSLYGCPVLVVRSQLSNHLPVCPASVIHCTMEWNRWPVCSSERRAHVPFKQSNPIVVPQQLDMALALRDQQILNESLKASRKIRRVLKNNLTQKYPAVPFPYHSNDHHGRGDGPRERSATPPGLQSSICNELYKATQRTTESLSAALQDILSNSNNENTSDSTNGANEENDDEYISSGALNSSNYNLSAYNTFDSEKWKENIILRTEPPPAGVVTHTASRHVTSPSSAKPTHSYLSIAPNELNIQCAHCRKWRERLQLLPDPVKDTDDKPDEKCDLQQEDTETLQGDVNGASGQDMNGECTNKQKTDEAVGSIQGRPGVVDFMPIEATGSKSLDTPCSDSSSDLDMPMFATESIVSDVCAAAARDNSCTRVTNPPTLSFTAPPIAPLPSLGGYQTLGLDLTLEAISRYQPKPKSMYTFLCNQEFRRDEFPSHFQNVHSEIHGGLNGWLEQRCPLASYGCTFSERRLYPGTKEACVIHNRDLASFGIQPGITDAKSSDGEKMEVEDDDQSTDLISGLPFELLIYISRFLDSFSLCNLSMTSRLMREVCCALLEERGIVIQHWRRTKFGDHYSWTIAYQVWQFSTSFSPVPSWGFDDIPSIAEHLKTCPFNNRLSHTKPFRVMPFHDSDGSEILKDRVSGTKE